ncbi:uncharacterized protein LOC127809888 isoform X2 [Diospyros lotus]|uniref:uncharacterized protein LOC127809888 isoform X2 n=1 Tax=Diospyros lotus TaxID=55363 RepID=UPI002254D30B|nr:uncharacterized protein LOC127809888 isoform X2 [Diospyros lotus]
MSAEDTVPPGLQLGPSGSLMEPPASATSSPPPALATSNPPPSPATSNPPPALAASNPPPALAANVPGPLVYKNRLQEYTQRSVLPFPSYDTVNEGSQHAPMFRSTVLVDGAYYTSPNAFRHRRAAEQDAARVALDAIMQKIKDEGCPLIGEDTIFCKSILNEYAAKMNLEKPTYKTIQEEGLLPLFVSSLVFNGVTYMGKAGRNKKEAEQLAARVVILSILGDSDSGMSMSEIIKSKFKLYTVFQKDYSHNSYSGGMPGAANVITSLGFGAANLGTGLGFGDANIGTGSGFGAANVGSGLGFGAANVGTGSGLGAGNVGTGSGLCAANVGIGSGLGTANVGVGSGLGAANVGTGSGLGTANVGAGSDLGIANVGTGIGFGAANVATGLGFHASKDKESQVTGGPITLPKSEISETCLGQLTNVPKDQQPSLQFMQPEVTSSFAANTAPIEFVPPVLEQPLDADSGPARKRRRKNKKAKKQVQVNAILPVASQVPTCSVAQ